MRSKLDNQISHNDSLDTKAGILFGLLAVTLATAAGTKDFVEAPKFLGAINRNQDFVQVSRSFGDHPQMKVKTKATQDDKLVAAFPGRRIRHFQKQGYVEEELKTRRSQVPNRIKVEEPASLRMRTLRESALEIL